MGGDTPGFLDDKIRSVPGERNRQRAGAGRERSGEEAPREHLAQEGTRG